MMSEDLGEIYDLLEDFFDTIYAADEKLREIMTKEIEFPRTERWRFDEIYDIHHKLTDIYIDTVKLLKKLRRELGYE